MNSIIILPLLALGIWMSALYTDSKFEYLYKGKNEKLLARGQRRWKRFLILHNKALKYLGLSLLWLGSSIAIVLTNNDLTMLPIIGYCIGLMGLFLYILSSIWPFIGRK